MSNDDIIHPPKNIPLADLTERTLVFNDGTEKTLKTLTLAYEYSVISATIGAYIATPVREDRDSIILHKLTTTYRWKTDHNVTGTDVLWLNDKMEVVDIEAYKISDNSLSHSSVVGAFAEASTLRNRQAAFDDLQKKTETHGTFEQLLEANSRLRAKASEHTRIEYDLKEEARKLKNMIQSAEDRMRDALLQRDKAVSDSRLLAAQVADKDRMIGRLQIDYAELEEKYLQLAGGNGSGDAPVTLTPGTLEGPAPSISIRGKNATVTINVYNGVATDISESERTQTVS